MKALGEAEELNQGAQESTISMLVSKFGVDEKELRATIQQNPDSRYQILKKGLTYEQSKEFEEITGDKKKYPNVTGIWLEENYKRTYPYNSLASTVAVSYTHLYRLYVKNLESSGHWWYCSCLRFFCIAYCLSHKMHRICMDLLLRPEFLCILHFRLFLM